MHHTKELKLEGDRLHFELETGSGPQNGWVSTKLKDKVHGPKGWGDFVTLWCIFFPEMSCGEGGEHRIEVVLER